MSQCSTTEQHQPGGISSLLKENVKTVQGTFTEDQLYARNFLSLVNGDRGKKLSHELNSVSSLSLPHIY